MRAPPLSYSCMGGTCEGAGTIGVQVRHRRGQGPEPADGPSRVSWGPLGQAFGSEQLEKEQRPPNRTRRRGVVHERDARYGVALTRARRVWPTGQQAHDGGATARYTL